MYHHGFVFNNDLCCCKCLLSTKNTMLRYAIEMVKQCYYKDYIIYFKKLSLPHIKAYTRINYIEHTHIVFLVYLHLKQIDLVPALDFKYSCILQ